MNNPLLTANPDLLAGSSALLSTDCTATNGPANIDGRCIMGGVRSYDHNRGGEGQCVAFPIYVLTNVPYTNGQISGSDYNKLSRLYNYTKLNEQWTTAS